MPTACSSHRPICSSIDAVSIEPLLKNDNVHIEMRIQHSAFSIQSTSVYFMNLTNANECEEHSHVLFTISPISHFCHVTRSHHVNLSVARIFSFLMMLFFVSDHCISFCLMQHDVASVVTVFFKWSLYACIQQLNVELSNFSIQIYELKVPFVQCKLWLMT